MGKNKGKGKKGGKSAANQSNPEALKVSVKPSPLNVKLKFDHRTWAMRST